MKSTPATHARIHALIRADPGIHIRRVAFLTGLSWNTIQYHLRRMEARGMVVSEKVEGNVCFFDRAAGAFHGKAGQALLRDARNVLLARHLIQHGGMSQKELAEGLGLAASVIHRRVSKFEEAGLIERVPEGRSLLVFAKEDLTVGLGRVGLLPKHDDVQVDLQAAAQDVVVEAAEAVQLKPDGIGLAVATGSEA